MALVLALTVLASCGKNDTEGKMSLILHGETDTVYTVDLSKVEGEEGLISVLDYLKGAEGLVYTAQDSAYGKYLTSVGTLVPGAANEYISIYTSVAEDADVSAYATEITVGGVTYPSSGVGASAMHVQKDATVVIALGSY